MGYSVQAIYLCGNNIMAKLPVLVLWLTQKTVLHRCIGNPRSSVPHGEETRNVKTDLLIQRIFHWYPLNALKENVAVLDVMKILCFSVVQNKPCSCCNTTQGSL